MHLCSLINMCTVLHSKLIIVQLTLFDVFRLREVFQNRSHSGRIEILLFTWNIQSLNQFMGTRYVFNYNTIVWFVYILYSSWGIWQDLPMGNECMTVWGRNKGWHCWWMYECMWEKAGWALLMNVWLYGETRVDTVDECMTVWGRNQVWHCWWMYDCMRKKPG